MCTAIYSIRLLYFVFLNNNIINGFYSLYYSANLDNVECSPAMFVSIFFLAFCSITVGYITSDLFLGSGQIFWQDSIFVLPCHFFNIDTEFIHPLIKNLPVILSLSALFSSWFLLYYIDYILIYKSNRYPLYKFFYRVYCIIASWGYQAGFFNTIYNFFFKYVFITSYVEINKYLDKGFFELLGPYGIYKNIRFLHYALKFSWYSIGYVTISMMFIGVILFIGYWFSIVSLVYVYFIRHLGLFIIFFVVYYLNAFK